jgi:acyl-lipid omega-6 desaturase (Delta-12 desaturase)
VASLTIGFQTYVLIQLPIILIGGALGLWLFYVQHQFENVYWARHEFWDPLRVALEGSSYFKLPKVLQWVSGNIGLHHIHHVRPNIPNYHLQQCYDDIRAFQVVKPLSIRTSLKSLRLSLYDEEPKKTDRVLLIEVSRFGVRAIHWSNFWLSCRLLREHIR